MFYKCCLSVCSLSSHLKDNFAGHIILDLMGIFFPHFKYLTLIFLPSLFLKRSLMWPISLCLSRYGGLCLSFFENALFAFGFLQFKCKHRCDFLNIYPAWCFDFPGSMVWCLSLTMENSQSLLQQVFLLFIYFPSGISHFHLVVSTPFLPDIPIMLSIIVPQLLHILLSFFLFSVCISVCEISLHVSLSSLILSSAIPSLLIIASKAILHYVIVLYISSLPFGLFLSLSIIQLTLPICSLASSTLPY